MPPTPEPLATLKAAKATINAATRYLNSSLRTDARRNIVTYDLKGQRVILARLRDTAARIGDVVRQMGGNGGGR